MVRIGDVKPNEGNGLHGAAGAACRGAGRVWFGSIGLAGTLLLGGFEPISPPDTRSSGIPFAFLNGIGEAAAAEEISHDLARGWSAAPVSQLAQASEDANPRIFVVQLASVTSEQEAEREWGQLKESFPDLLSGSRLLIERVELGGRGTFHRVQTGPFPDLRIAEKLCDQFKERSQDCLVMQISMGYPTSLEQAAVDADDSNVAPEPPDDIAKSNELFEQFLQWRSQKSEEQ